MKWQYQTIQVDVTGGQWTVGGKADIDTLTRTLNEQGEEGWELVAAFDTNQRQGATSSILLILKRAG